MKKYISFLLVPIMLLGVSNNSCYSMEDNNSGNNHQPNQNNNYLLITGLPINIRRALEVELDENDNIVENEKFLNNANYLNEISDEISEQITYFLSNDLHDKVPENIYRHFMTFLGYINGALCSNKYIYDFFARGIFDTTIALNQEFPPLIKLNNKYGDNITLQQLQNYLKNKIRLLLIQCCSEIINNQYNKDESELANLVINKTRNLYKDIRSILIWLPNFFRNTLRMNEEYFLLRDNDVIGSIVEYAMCLLNEDENIIAEEDEDLMLEYTHCYYIPHRSSIFCKTDSVVENIFNNFLKENSKCISKDTLSILSDVSKLDMMKLSNEFLSTLYSKKGNMQLSRTALNDALPGIIILNTSGKNGDNILLQQFARYLCNKIMFLTTQWITNIDKQSRKAKKNKDIKVLEDIIKQETEIFYDKFNRIISWLPQFLRDNNLSGCYLPCLYNTIRTINTLMLITNKDNNGDINIEENNNFLLCKYCLGDIYFEIQNKCRNSFKDINNWFKFYDMYEFFNSLCNYDNFLFFCSPYDDEELLPDKLKQSFYNIMTLPIEHNNDISIRQAFMYSSNKFQLLLINCLNEMQQYMKECKNDTKEYKKLNDRIKIARIPKMIHYRKQILNIMNWLKDSSTVKFSKFLQTHPEVTTRYNKLVDSYINQVTHLKSPVFAFFTDFDETMNKFEANIKDMLSKIPHDNNTAIENESFVTKNFDEALSSIYKIPTIFTNINNYKKYSIKPEISKWAYDKYNIIIDFDKKIKRCISIMGACILQVCEDFPEMSELLKENYFDRHTLNVNFKNILNKLHNNKNNNISQENNNTNQDEYNNKNSIILNNNTSQETNHNNPNIILDHEDFVYIGKDTEIYYYGLEEKVDPQRINILQLVRYCSNKILKEQINTLYKIVCDYKNEGANNFKQIIFNGCQRISDIVCVLYTFLESAKNNNELFKGQTNDDYLSYIDNFIQHLKDSKQTIDDFIKQIGLEN